MLKTNAAPVPRAISVNMFNLRLTSDIQPRSKKGSPHQTTTGVASRNWSQTMTRPAPVPAGLNPGTISVIEIKTSGIERTTLSQNRRLISISS